MSTDSTGASQAAPPVAPAVTEQPVAPAAPAVEATPAAVPDGTTVKLTDGTSKMASRTRVAERIRAREERAARESEKAEAARQKALGQPRVEAGVKEGGQFKEGEGTPAAATAPAEATPATPAAATAPASGTEAPKPTPAAATAPAGMVDIPLPDGHPLRDRGKTFIRVAQEFESEARNGINAAIRARELEVERDNLARNNALLEARTQALAGDLPNPERDPALKALRDQVRAAKWGDKTGDQMAEQLIASFQARERLAVIDAEGKATVEYEEARTAGQVFSDIQLEAGQVLAIWAQSGELAGRIPQLVKQYYAAVDQRNTRDGVNIPPSKAEFFEWVKPAYRADPRVQAAIQQLRQSESAKERERIRLEVQAEFERKQAEAATAATQRRSALPPTSRALPPQQSTTPAPAPAQPAAPKPGSHRRDARQRAGEIAQRYARPQQ